MNNIKELKNILEIKELFSIYNKLIENPVWYLSRKSHNNHMASGFPGFIISQEDNVYNPYWYGFFECLLDKIRKECKKEHNIILPQKILRIHLVAKNENSDTDFHTDNESEDAYSVVGFLTPCWINEWGGNFICENESINYTPGNFVIIKSNKSHNGLGPKFKIPYWRIVVNYILIN